MANTTWINAKTGDYESKVGIIQRNNPLLTEAYTRIITPIGSYIFDKNFGSYLTLWINTRKKYTTDEIPSEISRCLQPIYTQGRVNSVSVEVSSISKGAVFFSVSMIDLNNNIISLQSNYIAA